MKKLCVAFLIMQMVTAFAPAQGQTFEKIQFNEKEADDYYILLRPNSAEIKGVLVLLPGFGEEPEAIFPESKLFNVSYNNGIITMAIAGGQKLYADESVVDKLNRGIAHLLRKYPNLNKNNFVIGGFSAGGTLSLRYTEYCHQNPSQFPILPKGVFAVDSPIDLFSIWDYFQHEIEKNYSKPGMDEAKFVTEIMRKEIGTPTANEARYKQLSPFQINLKGAGNEKYLQKVAVRVYEDTDVEWQLKQRRRSLYDTNQLVASELINRLLLSGNEQAEFVTAKTPGSRSNGMRHPHSWSIVDEVECVQWCLKLFEVK